VTASCNVLLYGGYLVCLSKFRYAPDFWKVGDTCGTVGWWLALWGLTGALVGKGPLRLFLILNCVLGMFLWIPIGI
jgi:hypothetical protein